MFEKFWRNSWTNPSKDYTGGTHVETPRKIFTGILVELFLQKSLEFFLEISLEEYLTKFLEGLLKIFLEPHRNRSKNLVAVQSSPWRNSRRTLW